MPSMSSHRLAMRRQRKKNKKRKAAYSSRRPSNPRWTSTESTLRIFPHG